MGYLNTWKHIVLFMDIENSADPDQMPQNAASDQGLHCLLTEYYRMKNTTQRLLKLKLSGPIVESDEPVQPPFKFRNSKCCSVSSFTFIEYSSDYQRLCSDCAYGQADAQSDLRPACRTYHIIGNLMSRLICLFRIEGACDPNLF